MPTRKRCKISFAVQLSFEEGAKLLHPLNFLSCHIVIARIRLNAVTSLRIMMIPFLEPLEYGDFAVFFSINGNIFAIFYILSTSTFFTPLLIIMYSA